MAKIPAVAMRGDLGLISLFDLSQLLRLNGATGCLTIQSGRRTGALYFDKGELINAVDDILNEGEEAAIGLLAWQVGTFEFRADVIDTTHVIESSTESVLLEAARRLDESGLALHEDPDASATRRLAEREAAMEALRDVLHLLAGESSESKVTALGTTTQIYELSQLEDRLVYRPGHPPRMRRRGGWSRVPEPPLDQERYDELRTRLFEACEPVLSDDGRVMPSRRMKLSDGRVLELDLVADASGESMWLRPAAAAPQPRAAFAGDLAGLGRLLRMPESLLLLGAADLGTARRLMEAVACRATGPADTLVVVSRDAACRPVPDTGFVLHIPASALRATLEMVEPEIVALDPGLKARDVALEDLACVPRVFAGLIARNPATFATRWLYRAVPNQGEPARAWIAGCLAGIISARPTPGDANALTIAAWALEGEDREAALRGDPSALKERPAPRPKR
jgi:hypothetical protein